MQLIPSNLTVDFVRMRFIAAALSAALLIFSVYELSTKGLNFGIDFTGGTKIEVIYDQDIEIARVRQVLADANFGETVVQYFGSNQDIMIRLPLAEGQQDSGVSTRVVDALADTFGEGTLKSVEFVGPTFGKELFEKGILALVYALIMVMIYVAFRFEWKFSLGSVAALIHDIIITLGVFSLMSYEFSMPVLAALMAVIGYSLNDTIVVFDRIRENFRRLRETPPMETVNFSINQTLPRTILTSATTLLVLFALYIFGGEALSGFAATLIIGIGIGTYSSIFVASPIVLALGVQASDLMVEEVEKEGADLP